MRRKCGVGWCMRPIRSRGLCSTHYAQAVSGRAEFSTKRGRGGSVLLVAPCPAPCGLQTYARSNARSGERARDCAAGHSTIWSTDDLLQFIRRALTIDEVTKWKSPICYFPECDRPRKKHGTRWCEGHEKQKLRHGESAMKPLAFRCTWR